MTNQRSTDVQTRHLCLINELFGDCYVCQSIIFNFLMFGMWQNDLVPETKSRRKLRFGKKKSTGKHHQSAKPVGNGERIAEQVDRDDEREEFSQSDEQSDGERCTMFRQHENAFGTCKLGEHIKQQKKPKTRHLTEKRYVRILGQIYG